MEMVMKIATISIASTSAPLPRMISVVEVTSYLAQCALRMKLTPMIVVMRTLIMMTIMKRKIKKILPMNNDDDCMLYVAGVAYPHEDGPRRQW